MAAERRLDRSGVELPQDTAGSSCRLVLSATSGRTQGTNGAHNPKRAWAERQRCASVAPPAHLAFERGPIGFLDGVAGYSSAFGLERVCRPNPIEGCFRLSLH